MDHQDVMEPPVNLACLVHQVLLASQDLPVPREKRGILVSLVFQELLDRRELQAYQAYQAVQERLDWPACLDQWDLLDQPGPLALLDQVIVLDLMTWRALVEFSQMDFLVLEDLKEYRVLLVCLDCRVKLGCLASRVRRAVKVLREETGDRDWTASLDRRDQRVSTATKERGVKQAEMELDSQDLQAHLDPQDRSSINHLADMMVL